MEQDLVETLTDKPHHVPLKKYDRDFVDVGVPPENRGNHLHFYRLHDLHILPQALESLVLFIFLQF